MRKAQIYAAHCFEVLMVNYRGSKRYGQALADAILGARENERVKKIQIDSE